MKPSKDTVKLKVISTFLVVLVLPSVLGNLYIVPKNELPRNVAANNDLSQFSFENLLNNMRGKPGQGYYIEVEIGTPKQKFNIIVDTGSSNFAVACSPHSDITSFFNTSQSSSYHNTGGSVEVPYTEGSWSGVLGQDYVSFPSMPNVSVMANIACITESQGFFINGSNWQGIMGLAYSKIARPDSSMEPLFDSLVGAGQVDNQMTVQLCGSRFTQSNPDNDVGGTLVFGKTDHNRTLYTTPIVKQWYYEVVMVDIEVAGKSLAMDCKEYNFGRTIVDTGTTNLRLPIRVFNTLVTLINKHLKSRNLTLPNDGFWTGDEVLCWNNSQIPYIEFPEISLILPQDHTTAFRLIVPPQQYMRHVVEDTYTEETDCYKFGISSLQEGSVLGSVVLEGFYVVIDRTGTVKFGESSCEVAIPSRIHGNISYTGNYGDCIYHEPDLSTNRTVVIVGYVMGGITAVCLLPLLILAIHGQARRLGCFRSRLRRQNSDMKDLMHTN